MTANAQRFEPTFRELSETLTAIALFGLWGVDGLYSHYFEEDEFEWTPFDQPCTTCHGKGYLEEYRECKTCKTSGSLLVALSLEDKRQEPEPYLGTLLRQKLNIETNNEPSLSNDDLNYIFSQMAEDAHVDPELYSS